MLSYAKIVNRKLRCKGKPNQFQWLARFFTTDTQKTSCYFYIKIHFYQIQSRHFEEKNTFPFFSLTVQVKLGYWPN